MEKKIYLQIIRAICILTVVITVNDLIPRIYPDVVHINNERM